VQYDFLAAYEADFCVKRFQMIWRPILSTFSLRPTRSRTTRAISLLFAYCLLNSVWSLIGDWSICFGGESYVYHDHRDRRSGIFSSRGFLVLAVRDSTGIYSGLRPLPGDTRTPNRQPIPLYIRANLFIGPGMFQGHRLSGTFDDEPHTLFPGLIVNWQTRPDEWYTRGIAIHWTLLIAITGPWPIITAIRKRRRPIAGLCTNCGYDLRATPDRCPECGLVPEQVAKRNSV